MSTQRIRCEDDGIKKNTHVSLEPELKYEKKNYSPQ